MGSCYIIFGLLLIISICSITKADEPTCSNEPEIAKLAGAPTVNLTLKLYEKIAAQNPDKNLIFSPISIILTLALLEKGASGATQAQLQEILGTPEMNTDVHRVYESLQNQLKGNNVKRNLSIANGLFHARDITLKSEFLNRVSCVQAEVQKVNFQDKARALKKINGWVSKKTCGKIRRLLSPDSIDATTQAVLTNAVYLKTSWDEPFRLSPNKGVFYRNGQDNDRQEVQFFQRVEYFGYIDAPSYRAVRMPYADHNLAMIVALPKERDGIRDLEQLITQEESNNPLLLQFAHNSVEVHLPRFALRLKTQLTQILKEIGLTNVFSDEADFSRLSEQRITFADVIHEGYVKVNENGTEAAASTAVVTWRSFKDPASAIQFVADHPFVFAIIHRSTNTVLFMGKVTEIEDST